ncbi:hypothetical protein EXIGLDRAFT_830515 [Exidia glandulosa HHB12029]|uniref:GYF domain-containing protein n=1 Tax=Exidia glandulosa HHB12029 TaxID=1314781 RepID=A0A165NE20_EXIGL|nr:hypothetical protein EXIGLDRAFT_830515 [Exidia glandulosa HHB12029]
MSSRKRPAESQPGPAKRTRFVEPEDDPARFEETVDDALETSNRKGAVKTDGYESDSTDEGEGVVYSRHKKDGDADGEDDDMFAMDDDGDKPKSSAAHDGGKKKKTEFLQLGDIEGQEFAENGDDSDDSEDEADALDEDDAERIRRKKALGYDDKSMGYELSSFNMKQEMEEGKFAADGSYMRSLDPHDMHDRWLEGTDEREIKKARKAYKARLKKEAELEKKENVVVRKEERERDLICLMRPSESVLETLQRLGVKKKSQAKDRKKKDKDSMAIDTVAPHGTAHTKTKVELDIEKITELASELMVDNIDIYSTTYEELLRSVRRSKIVPDDWKPPEDKFEYRWKGGDGTTFGSFSLEEMIAWKDADYFGDGAEKIEIRKVGVDGAWGAWNDAVA